MSIIQQYTKPLFQAFNAIDPQSINIVCLQKNVNNSILNNWNKLEPISTIFCT